MANSPSLAKSGRSAAKFGDLRRRAMFLLLALIVYRIGAHIPVPGIDPDQLAKLFQSQSGRHSWHVQHVLGWRAVEVHDFRAWDHAVHLGVDHHAVDVDRFAADGSAEEGRAVGAAEDYAVHALLHRRSGYVSGVRHCGRAGKSGRARYRSRHGVSVDDGGDAGDRHDVPDVAGRADHGTRSG